VPVLNCTDYFPDQQSHPSTIPHGSKPSLPRGLSGRLWAPGRVTPTRRLFFGTGAAHVGLSQFDSPYSPDLPHFTNGVL